MDTRLLTIFSAVARHNSLTLAAQEIHLTPSALSHSIKTLETELGCRLFDRVGNRLVLNQAGEQLLADVEKPLAAIRNAAIALKTLNRWGQGRLRIGAAITICQYVLPAALRDLRREFPKIQLKVESGDSPRLLELLRQHEVDLVLMVESEGAADLDVSPWFEDELMFVVGADHPWTDGRSLSKEEIRQQTLILYQRTSVTAQLLDKYLKENAIEPNSIMEIASMTAIKEMVKLNLGISVLAPWTVDAELTRGRLRMRTLSNKAIKRKWVFAHLARRRLGMPEDRFLKICQAHASGMRLDRHDLPERGRIRVN
jgi:LysR family transcriptional regulator, low CO2-responsive transcriptional regulator